MQVNNLGGVRVTTTNSTSQTAQTRFSSLVSGGPAAPTAGRAAIPGSSVISTAISANTGMVPGAALGTPYRQAMSGVVPGMGVPSVNTTPSSGTGVASPNTSVAGTNPQAPSLPGAGNGAAGTEFNGELAAMFEQQKAVAALKELMKLSLVSFAGGTFSLGQSRPKIEALED